MVTKAKKTRRQRAIELVERMTGEKVQTGHRNNWVEYGDCILSWHEDAGSDRVELVHVRRTNDIPDSQTDYFPGTFYDTIEAALKRLVRSSRKEDGDAVQTLLGDWGCLNVEIGWKSGAGFVPQATVGVCRWVQAPTRSWATAVFHTEYFVLWGEADLDMCRRFVAGEVPVGVFLDWLQDRDMEGLPEVLPYGRQPKNPPLVQGRLDRFLARPAGERRTPLVEGAR